MRFRSPLRFALVCLASMSLNAARADLVMDFSSPVPLSPYSGSGVWFPDRSSPPAVFQGQVNFMGDDRLLETISASDYRPTDDYRNTQGRVYRLEPTTQSMSIDIYIDPTWARAVTSVGTARYGSFWGVGINGASATATYPIMEVVSLEGSTGLAIRFWDNSTGWQTAWDIPDSDLGTFANLSMSLSGGNINYSYNGNLIGTVGGYGTVAMNAVILHGYNAGTTYDIYWDNFSSQSAVPEPSSLITSAIAVMGIGLAAARRGRRTTSSAS